MQNLPSNFIGEFAATRAISGLPTIANEVRCLYTAAILGSATTAITADLTKLAGFGIAAANAETKEHFAS
jgi:hypothetical protein